MFEVCTNIFRDISHSETAHLLLKIILKWSVITQELLVSI